MIWGIFTPSPGSCAILGDGGNATKLGVVCGCAGFHTVDEQEVVQPLNSMHMWSCDMMRVVLRRVLEMQLSRGPVCAECEEGGEASDGGCLGGAGAAHDDGTDVNFSTSSLTSESVGQWGVFLCNELYFVPTVSICAVFPFTNLNLFIRGVTALVNRVSDEFGLEEADEIGFVGGGSE
jgi:hypothetical protein